MYTPAGINELVPLERQAERFGSRPLQITESPLSNSFRYSFPGSSGLLFLSNRVNPDSSIGEPDGFTALITQANLVDNGGRTVRGITPSRGGLVLASTYVGNGSDALDYFVERNFETTLPVSGAVDYSGSYMAVYRFSDSLAPAGHITGAVELTVDFDASEVNGRIFGRSNTGVNTLAPITLEAGTLENGSFRGSTTGGYFNGGGTSALPGSYSGMITGSNGDEAIGGLTLTHRANGGDRFDEVGVFIAD